MKPTRFLTVALVLMGLVATTSAAITQAGTDITNQAFGNYQDANGHDMDQVTSLIVTTQVSQVAGVSLTGVLASPISAMDSTLYVVTLNNTGNFQDTFTIGATGSAPADSFDFYVFHDLDASGTINSGDTEVTSSGLVAFLGDYDLLIKVVDATAIGSNPGDIHTVTLTATSIFNGDSTDVVELVSTVQAAAVTGITKIIGDNTPEPGAPIVYESCFTNAGTEIAYNPVYVTTMPDNTTLDVTSVKINDGNAVTITSTALDPILADLPYHYNTATRTLTVELDDLGFTTGVDEVCVQFTAVVDDPLTAGAVIDFPAGSPEFTYENFGGDPYPGANPSEDPTTIPSGNIEVAQTYGVTLASGGVNAPYTYIGAPQDTLIFDFTVSNDGNGADNFDFTDASTYVTWVYYVDTNEDGALSESEKLAGAVTASGVLTSTGTTPAVGYYIAIGTIPVGTNDTVTDATTITATSPAAALLDPAQTITTTITNSTTCARPILTLVKSVSQTLTQGGLTYYSGEVNSFAPGDTLIYSILVANGGTGVATTVVVSDAFHTNTTYVLESMTVGPVAAPIADDDADGASDNASLSGSSVLFEFDSIPAVTTGDDTDQRIMTFMVTIN